MLVLIEYVPYGDLLGYLRKSRGLNDTYYRDPDVKPQTCLRADQLLKFAWQIADGMSYLSSKKVYPVSYKAICTMKWLHSFHKLKGEKANEKKRDAKPCILNEVCATYLMFFFFYIHSFLYCLALSGDLDGLLITTLAHQVNGLLAY